jgi:hypothetical protein
MPKGKDRTLVPITMTPAQRAALETLAGKKGASAYLRALIAHDAATRGIEWPDDLGAPGPRLDYERRRLAADRLEVALRGLPPLVDDDESEGGRDAQD